MTTPNTLQHPVEVLAKLFLRVPREMSSYARWKKYQELPAQEREDTLAHSWNATLLMAIMLELEEEHGSLAELSPVRLLMAAHLHDIGEGAIGDVTYVVKQDPRVRRQLEEIEREQATMMLAGLWPRVQERFTAAYNVQYDHATREGRFFNAMERVGYIYFAVVQVRMGRKSFVEVYERQHDALVAHCEEFASVRVLYEPLREEVMRELDASLRAKIPQK